MPASTPALRWHADTSARVGRRLGKTPLPFLGTAKRLWSVDSPINALIPANPVLDPNSASIASVLAAEGNNRLSVIAYGSTVYYATPQTPRLTTGAVGSGAQLEIAKMGSGGDFYSPTNPFAGAGTIPVDPSWIGAPGYPFEGYSDGAVSIVDVDGKVFGFWQLLPAVAGQPRRISWGGWSWGRDSDIAPTDQGVGSATGARFNRLAGLVTRADLELGRIDHALVFASKHTRPTQVLYPATKTDGSYLVGIGSGWTAANSIPEAQRIQLDPTINLDAIPGITGYEKMIGRALQRHGAYCIDNGGGTPMQFIAETPPAGGWTYNGEYSFTMHDPVYLAQGISSSAPNMPKIPWASLRVLKNWNGAA